MSAASKVADHSPSALPRHKILRERRASFGFASAPEENNADHGKGLVPYASAVLCGQIEMMEPIKRDLATSDTQISLLQGFAFAIFGAILGIPLYALLQKNPNAADLS